jgi:transcriptional regulator with XRE-family HTH domain
MDVSAGTSYAEGPEAVAELEAFRLHFSLARQRAERRRARHLTQKQLAERSGIDQAEISRIERGRSYPTTTTLGAITRALAVDVQLVPVETDDVQLGSRDLPGRPTRRGCEAALDWVGARPYGRGSTFVESARSGDLDHDRNGGVRLRGPP